MTTSLTFIETNKLPRVKTPQGEVTEILNQQLVGAKNVFGNAALALAWGKIPTRRNKRNISSFT